MDEDYEKIFLFIVLWVFKGANMFWLARNVMKKKAIPTLSFYNSFNMMDNGQEGISLHKE